MKRKLNNLTETPAFSNNCAVTIVNHAYTETFIVQSILQNSHSKFFKRDRINGRITIAQYFWIDALWIYTSE